MSRIFKISVAFYLVLFLFSVNTIAEQDPYFSRMITAREAQITKLSNHISTKYNINYNLSNSIVRTAYEYEDSHFPRAIDILSIIAIESSFDLTAKSTSNAKGLMQILYKRTHYDIRNNMLDGVWLLKDYSRKLIIKENVIQAYNVGIGSFYKGKRNKDYLNKFKKTKEGFQSITA